MKINFQIEINIFCDKKFGSVLKPTYIYIAIVEPKINSKFCTYILCVKVHIRITFSMYLHMYVCNKNYRETFANIYTKTN